MVNETKWTESELISVIQSDNENCESAVKWIWTYHRKKAKSNLKLKVGKKYFDDAIANDEYNQSVLALKENIEKGKIIEDGKLGAYLFVIFYRKYIKRKNISSKLVLLENSEVDYFANSVADETNNPLEIVETKELQGVIKKNMDLLGEKCKTILIEYYINLKRQKDIAEVLKMGVQNIKNSIKPCRDKLRGLFTNDPNAMDYISEIIQIKKN
ncbi:sigma-70 family RNA polymerase sigma factor [Saprospiraceae bacterium]|nr:sigma-70 family RNA polymerase sigma factor [Saprospiraceae bacterium]